VSDKLVKTFVCPASRTRD